MSLVLLLDFSSIAVEGAKRAIVGVLVATKLVGMRILVELGLGERTWVEAVTYMAGLRLGSTRWGEFSFNHVSAYEHFKEAGEDIGGVRRLMELTGDAGRYWLFCHIEMICQPVVTRVVLSVALSIEEKLFALRSHDTGSTGEKT